MNFLIITFILITTPLSIIEYQIRIIKYHMTEKLSYICSKLWPSSLWIIPNMVKSLPGNQFPDVRVHKLHNVSLINIQIFELLHIYILFIMYIVFDGLSITALQAPQVHIFFEARLHHDGPSVLVIVFQRSVTWAQLPSDHIKTYHGLGSTCLSIVQGQHGDYMSWSRVEQKS